MTRIRMLSLSSVLVLTIAIGACGGGQRSSTTPTAPTSPSGGSAALSNTGGGTAPTAPTTPTTAPTAGGADPMCANHPDELGPWLLTPDQMNQRIGTGVTALASMPTTKEHTIEVCGVPAENVWLASSTCADGSHPYPGPDAVEASRAGNVGEGGRCGGIIDLYKAKCPEKTYDVYIDMNLCGPGEKFQ